MKHVLMFAAAAYVLSLALHTTVEAVGAAIEISGVHGVHVETRETLACTSF